VVGKEEYEENKMNFDISVVARQIWLKFGIEGVTPASFHSKSRGS